MNDSARMGFKDDNALKRADELYVNVNIHNDDNKEKLESLRSLPTSCYESAIALDEARAAFEQDGVFPPEMIDGMIKKLKGYKDKHLRAEIAGNRQEMLDLVAKFWHCG